MQVHLNAAQTVQAQEGELSLNFIKKYIGYCRKYVIFLCSALINFILWKFWQIRVENDLTFISSSKCGPRLSEEAAQMLKNRYVLMRSGARDYERDAEKKINIPITVRYMLLIFKSNAYL